jgi:ABC-type polysaccharide/polyol phosphate export permease
MSQKNSPFINELLFLYHKQETWLYLAFFDIYLRYKRTKLGPFWLVIISFISIACMSVLSSLLFKVKLSDYFPYVACGMIIWAFIASIVSESCTIFQSQAGQIKCVDVPVLSFCLRMYVRNLIVFFHNLIVIFIVILCCNVPLNFNLLMIVPALIIYGFMALALGIILGFLCTRFRDLTQLVQALLNVLGFLTPIMWQPSMLDDKAYIAYLNPFSHYVAILREPLLGQFPNTLSLTITILFTAVCMYIAAIIFNRLSKKLVYWL